MNTSFYLPNLGRSNEAVTLFHVRGMIELLSKMLRYTPLGSCCNF